MTVAYRNVVIYGIATKQQPKIQTQKIIPLGKIKTTKLLSMKFTMLSVQSVAIIVVAHVHS